MVNLSAIAPYDNSSFDENKSGIYLVIGPTDLVSDLPTENILFIFRNGDISCEGKDFRLMYSKEEYERKIIILLTRSSEHKSLSEHLYNDIPERLEYIKK